MLANSKNKSCLLAAYIISFLIALLVIILAIKYTGINYKSRVSIGVQNLKILYAMIYKTKFNI